MQIKQFLKLNYIPILLVLTSALFYFSFGYDLERTDSIKLLMLYAALFFLFYKLVQLLKHNLKFLTWIAFGFRAIFILAIPNLSQDFYRFIWDGRMILEGFNPYLFTPESFIFQSEFPVAQAQELYNGMGTLNGSHYTNYPPLNQLCFVVAGLFAGKSILGSVIIMRLLIIAADFGTLIFGKKLLEKLNLPAYHIFWYLLNPFIIIELTGNLHFEGVMIFFLVWSLYLLHIGKWKIAAIAFACSVSIKLIPLIFLPLFFKWFRYDISNHHEIATSQVPRNDIVKLLTFYLIIGIVTLLLFLPFFSSEFISNYVETVVLWFNNFEFNASVYYIIRSIGYLFVDFNINSYYGTAIAILTLIFVFVFAFKKNIKTTQQLITAMLLVLSFYYFTSTTVHPWYVAMLLILSVFTNYKFPLVWSFAIILSYLAYNNIDSANKSENLWIIGLEYVIVFGVFIWEVVLKKNFNKLGDR